MPLRSLNLCLPLTPKHARAQPKPVTEYVPGYRFQVRDEEVS